MFCWLFIDIFNTIRHGFMMKKIIALLTGMALFAVSYSQSYIPVNDSSKVEFTIKNLGFNVRGSFTGLQGTIHFDAAHPEKSVFNVHIDAASVNTGNDTRDNHLRSDDYFDCKNYPRITFVSTKVSSGGKAGTFFIEGTLTIKNISKPLSFPFTVIPTNGGYWMEGEFGLQRKPFTVGKTSTISDKLSVSLKVLARKA
jgi:polyisoprenoid-binding protein YceI